MIGPRRFATWAAAGCCILTLGACSRTSDGTVVVPAPQMSFSMPRSFMPSWARRAPEPEPQPMVAEQFPPPPAALSTEAPGPRRAGPRRAVREADLACVNRTDSRGRVRVVCK